MPVPSFFKRKASSSSSSKTNDTKSKQKYKTADGDNGDDVDSSKTTAASNSVFNGDENLLQLHAETTELLRLVKTPAKAKSCTSAKRHGSPVKTRAPVRQTIEVLENDDEEDEDDEVAGEQKTMKESVPPARHPSSSGASLAPVDPFAFDAEEARVRKASDTFLPDTSPSKRDVERQRGHLASERSRLQRIETSDEMRQQRRRYEAETRQPVVDRVQDSATVIQAHSRGFLARKHAEKEKQRLVEEAQREQQRQEALQWHEVRDVAKNEVWFYNAVTGQSQWERPAVMAMATPNQGPGFAELPAIQPSTASTSTVTTATTTTSTTGYTSVLPRVALSSSSAQSLSYTDLPPLSPSTSRPNSSSSNCSTTLSSSSRPQSSTKRTTLALSSSSSPLLPSLTTTTTATTMTTTSLPFDYGASSVSSRPWECDSVAGSSSDQMSLCSERFEDQDDDDGQDELDFSRGRRSQLHQHQQLPFENDNGDGGDDDWQVNDSLFLADGSKNSKLRDTIRSALQTSKFDSVSSLIASNVVLRKKPHKGRRDQQQPLVQDTHEGNHPNQQRTATGAAVGSSPSRSREIVLGRRDAPMFVAVLDKTRQRTATSGSRSPTKKPPTTKRRPPTTSAAIGSDPSNPLAVTPQILDLVDPGLYEDLNGSSTSSSSSPNKKKAVSSPEKSSETSTPTSTVVCFNCWSSSNGRHCDAHQDASDFRKVKSSESALMCANWNLDQLRKKYRSEEIQEIFMKQNASLRYDKRLKQYITVIEAKHPIYRLSEQLTTAWNKTMRRKIHTRAWFRSFIEQLRAGGVPKADASTPKLMKLKNTLQNHRWCTKYSDTVREFHPRAPVTAKTHNGKIGRRTGVVPDVIMVDPAHPQLANWMLTTDWTKPVALYRPRKYELPPRRCVPMPTPSFLEEIPLPVPNLFIDCGHVASWFERLSARVATAAIHKALLQIQACSPPRGATDARKTKHVTPVTVLFATFGRKPTAGMLAVGGLSAELLIHMLVTTYIPAQYGHFIVFDRRVVAPLLTKDYDATFVCLEIDPITMSYIFRALEHALNVRRPPCIVVSTRLVPGSQETDATKRFPANRPDQTGEELAHGFRTYWLVEAFLVPDEVDCVAVQPTADVLSANTTSMNATMTTKVDRFYPFCIPTTKENTPIEFIHLLWIGQSSRNQPQTFTTLGAQQPGEFMKNSDPNGALGVCTSVVYRSWAYMQSSPFDEFTTDDGIAYWYDRQSGDTYWSRPVLPAEKHRGKDGDVDGVVVLGVGEVATLGVGVESSTSSNGGGARYSQHDLRKYMTKKMEAPEDKAKRIQRVGASARKHELVVTLGTTATTTPGSTTTPSKTFAKVQVPALEFHSSNTAKTKGVLQQPRVGGGGGAHSSSFSPVKPMAKSPQKSSGSSSSTSLEAGGMDANTKQLIATITQALGAAGGAVNGSTSGVDMLQLGIGLGMGLGLRSSQQQQNHQLVGTSSSRVRSSSRSNRSRPRSAESQVSFAEDDINEGFDEDGYQEGEDGEGGDDDVTTARSDSSSILSDVSSTARSTVSITVGPSPDELELLPEAERAKLLAQQHQQQQRAGYNQKTPGYRTHAPPGEGHTWLDKPIDSSSESQTAVDGYGGSLHQRVACLPKDFVAAVSSTKTCAMQANYLPVIKNTNQPRSVGIVRPRAALDEWLSVGYSPWSAGRATFGTQFIKNLLHRSELLAAQKSGATTATTTASTASSSAAVQVEKKENVTQAVKEAQQLETVFSLCRHGKYDELERMITSPDWTLAIDAKDVTGNTLLSIACQNNNKRIAKLCLRRGADLNTQNLNGQTVLHYCHEYGFHDLMDYLLDKGAKDDVVNADGLTCYEGLSKEAVDAI